MFWRFHLVLHVLFEAYLHELGHVPYADLAPLGGSRQEVRAAAEAVAGDLVRAVRTGELRWARRQGDRQWNVLRVLTLHKRTVGGMSLMFRPAIEKDFRLLTHFFRPDSDMNPEICSGSLSSGIKASTRN